MLFLAGLANSIRPFVATSPFSHTTTRSDGMVGFRVLTVRRIRFISSLSWCL
jgi:hypothetical protein